MSENKNLKNRQLVAINQIIASKTLEEAARKTKISKGTLYAWLKDENFKAELKSRRDEVMRDSLERLKCALSKAVDNLIGLMDSEQLNFKYRASKDVLEYALKTIDQEDTKERLERLEEVVEKRRRK